LIESTTIARDLITPETSALIDQAAKATIAANPKAAATWKALVDDIANTEGFHGDAYAMAQRHYPKEFEAYALDAYCKKTIDALDMPYNPANAPKITLADPLITDEILTGLMAELGKHEELVAKKPWRTLHLHHIQSRERLDKLKAKR
jgi:hypothetical protein